MADENGTKPGDSETVEVEVGREVIQVIQAVDGSHGVIQALCSCTTSVSYPGDNYLSSSWQNAQHGQREVVTWSLACDMQLLSKTLTQRCQ